MGHHDGSTVGDYLHTIYPFLMPPGSCAGVSHHQGRSSLSVRATVRFHHHEHIMRDALPIAAAHDPFANERALLTGEHRALPFLLLALIVQYNPVVGLAQLVRSGRVSK